MCMQRPVQVIRNQAPDVAIVASGGRDVPVSLAVLGAEGVSVRAGDWLLAIGGVAIQRISPGEARGLTEMVDAVRDGRVELGVARGQGEDTR